MKYLSFSGKLIRNTREFIVSTPNLQFNFSLLYSTVMLPTKGKGQLTVLLASIFSYSSIVIPYILQNFPNSNERSIKLKPQRLK